MVATRAVSPEAYEHVTRALLYEEEERWKEAADELQRALPFDPEAAEVRAQLAELFIRLDRLDDAAERDRAARCRSRRRSKATWPRRTWRRRYDDEAHHAQEIPALREAARLALAGDDRRVDRADAPGAVRGAGGVAGSRRRRWTPRDGWSTRSPRPCAAASSWRRWAGRRARSIEAAAALTAAIEIEPNDVEARILLAELQVATNKIDAAKDGFRAAIDRAESPMAVADAFAGWLILRGDVAEAQDLADRLVADAGDADTLAVASAFERTVKRPDRALALAERASKLGLPAGRRALLLGAAALAARTTRPARPPRT